MGETTYLRGNEAAALAAKLSRIEFMAAYPIPPSSEVMEGVRQYIDRGELKAGFVEADGEKNSIGASFGAASVGTRSFNATSGQGLLYMHEILHCMAGSRIPMVLAVGNRSVFAPHGMHCDHTDAMSQRDTGWLQLYCSTVQEVLDTIIQAFKIAEHGDVKLPTMVCYDGYFLTHSLERVDVPSQEEVDQFLPPYTPGETDHLEPGGLPLFTSFAYFDNWYMEFKYQQRMAEERAKKVIEDVDKEFADRFGRGYGGLIDVDRVSDADVVLVMMGSMAATAKHAINVMRQAGKRVGLIRVKSFRPFPKEALLEALQNSSVKSVIVLDRFFHDALFGEVRSALWSLRSSLLTMGVMCGINGRDVSPYNMIDLAEQGFAAIARGSVEEEVAMYMVRKREEAEA